MHFIHGRGYVHKDIHPGNIFVAQVGNATGGAGAAQVIKLGDLGISRLEPELGLHTTLAKWMVPPEALDPTQFGPIGKPLDIYHTSLSLLALLVRRLPQFNEAEIVAGKPRAMAEALQHPAAPAIGRGLRRHTMHRTQTPLEFWRDLKQCLKIP